MKLWQQSTASSAWTEAVQAFTTGLDREMDLMLAPYDVLGSLAHLAMLEQVGLVSTTEALALKRALQAIYQEIAAGQFELEPGAEDVHSQIEMLLTRRVGEAGKKIHTGRSRNDQVLVDLKLLFRAEIAQMVAKVKMLFDQLLAKSAAHAQDLMPGYTHFQVAMPSSVGLWLGAYAEGLSEDLFSMQAAFRLVQKNPLGSAAGYGSSFPLDRDLTTALLGFEAPHVNSVAAQMARGKTERALAQAMGNLAATLGKFSADCCLFMGQNFGFIAFPDALTTGSSIMPHKKNPDVFEIARARCNSLQALPNEIALITSNLPSGYHRDFQVLKEKLFPAFQVLKDCLDMIGLMVENMQVKQDILADARYRYVFTVESVNQLVLSGMPFREAYHQVSQQVTAGTYEPAPMLPHTHLGSIGNLGNDRIAAGMEAVLGGFGFERVLAAEQGLLGG